MNNQIEDRIRQIEDKLGRSIIDIFIEEEELNKKFPWGWDYMTNPFTVLPIEDLEFLYEHADIFDEKKVESDKTKNS